MFHEFRFQSGELVSERKAKMNEQMRLIEGKQSECVLFDEHTYETQK